MYGSDRKRKGSKPPNRGSTALSGSKKATGKAQRYNASSPSQEELLSTSSPALHLTPFQPPGPVNVLNIEHGAELDKLTSKLFGIPLASGTNFGLRIHPGSDPHVPLVAKDTIDWLAHYGT